MYKCEECGFVFEEPMINREYHGLEYGYEEYGVCPNCGERGYKEGKPCQICGEEQYDDGICEWCLDEAVGMLMVDFSHFVDADVMDLIDLFEKAIDTIYVQENKRRAK